MISRGLNRGRLGANDSTVAPSDADQLALALTAAVKVHATVVSLRCFLCVCSPDHPHHFLAPAFPCTQRFPSKHPPPPLLCFLCVCHAAPHPCPNTHTQHTHAHPTHIQHTHTHIQPNQVPERVRTGLWVGDCFIYNNAAWRLNYCVGGEVRGFRLFIG